MSSLGPKYRVLINPHPPVTETSRGEWLLPWHVHSGEWGGGKTLRAPTDPRMPKKGGAASVRMCTGKVHPT